MKMYKGGKWQYGEREVEEIGTGKRYTLTQKTKVLSEDFYTVYRTVAVPHSNEDLNFPYIYEVQYMIVSNGSCLVSRIVDEETMTVLLLTKTTDVLHGRIDFEKWFEGKDAKERSISSHQMSST